MKKIAIFNMESLSCEKRIIPFKIKIKTTKQNFVVRFANKLRSIRKDFKIHHFVQIATFPFSSTTNYKKYTFPILIKHTSANYYLTKFGIRNKFIVQNINRIYPLIKYHVLFHNNAGKEFIEPIPKNIFAIIKYNQNNLVSEEYIEYLKIVESEQIITPYIANYINTYLEE